jgi:hypothetical protein
MAFGKRQVASIERRAAVRAPCNIVASILVDGDKRIPCVIRNYSKMGALLLVSGHFGVPDQFRLQIGSAIWVPVQVVRRGKTILGVRFLAR